MIQCLIEILNYQRITFTMKCSRCHQVIQYAITIKINYDLFDSHDYTDDYYDYSDYLIPARLC
jgi:hypothetical protein